MLDFLGARRPGGPGKSACRLRALEAGLAAEGLRLNHGQTLSAAPPPAVSPHPACRSAWSVYSIQPNKPGWLLTI